MNHFLQIYDHVTYLCLQITTVGINLVSIYLSMKQRGLYIYQGGQFQKPHFNHPPGIFKVVLLNIYFEHFPFEEQCFERFAKVSIIFRQFMSSYITKMTQDPIFIFRKVGIVKPYKTLSIFKKCQNVNTWNNWKP